MLQLENLESRFAEFDDFLGQLTSKREDVYEAFSSRRQALLDERARRADRLADSATRVLSSVRRRVAGLTSLDEVNTYFGSDPMVLKLKGVAGELRALGDQVRAEELEGRIKSARQEAGRALRDRLDLYTDGGRPSGSAATCSRSTPRRPTSPWCPTGTGWRSPSPGPTTVPRCATRPSRTPGRSGTS